MDINQDRIRTDIEMRMHMAENGWEQTEIQYFIEWAGNRDRTETQWEQDAADFGRFLAEEKHEMEGEAAFMRRYPGVL